MWVMFMEELRSDWHTARPEGSFASPIFAGAQIGCTQDDVTGRERMGERRNPPGFRKLKLALSVGSSIPLWLGKRRTDDAM